MQRTNYLSPARDASIPGPAALAAYPRRRFPAPPRTAGTACPMTEGGTERRSLAATIARCLVRVARDRPLGAEAFPLLWW